MIDIVSAALKLSAQAYQENPKIRLWFMVYPIGFVSIFFFAFSQATGQIPFVVGESLVALSFVSILAFTIVISSYQSVKNEKKHSQKIERIEQEVKNNPEKTKAAWDLAQEKLESYLDRNLSQVQSIYRLCLLIMIFGFALISYGAYLIYIDSSKLSASVLSAISGIIISFLGGSFILIYKSTLNQAKEYVSMLERINAVGMSLQILDSLTSENAELRDKSKADIARELLGIYIKRTSKE